MYLEDEWPTHLQGKTSLEEKTKIITAHLIIKHKGVCMNICIYLKHKKHLTHTVHMCTRLNMNLYTPDNISSHSSDIPSS